MKKIIGISFPQYDILSYTAHKTYNKQQYFGSLSIQYSHSVPNLIHGVLPKGENVYYINDNNELKNIDDNEVELYLVSLYYYTDEFKEWAKKISKEKIIIGGYHPTFYDFDREELLQYTNKIIIGSCDDIFNTIQQPGAVVEGIINFKNLPRYDLFKKSKHNNIDGVFINFINGSYTTIGCNNHCNFCLGRQTSLGKVHIKPLDFLKQELLIMKDNSIFNDDVFFIYDPNFLINKNYKDILNIIKPYYKKILFSASLDNLNEENIIYLSDNNVSRIHFGLENVMENYDKNKNLKEKIFLLKNNNITLRPTIIVDSFKMQDENYFNEYFEKLDETLSIIQPYSFMTFKLQIQYNTALYYEYKQKFNIKQDVYSINLDPYLTDKNIDKKIILKLEEIYKKHHTRTKYVDSNKIMRYPF